MRTILLSVLLLFQAIFIHAQVIPSENDTVNYRLVGFSVPVNNKADNYLLEIAIGHFTDKNAFEKNVSIKKNSSANKIIQLLPAFRESYTWRVSYLKKDGILKSTGLYHFHTGYIPFVDTQRYRVSVLKNTISNNNLLIFYDNTRSLRDINGDPVWYIPNIDGITDSLTNVRDLKLTPQGTITFLTASKGYEIDYNGNILWACPDDGKVSHDTSEFYHHEFTRLANGHYMAAGNEYVEREILNATDTSRFSRNPRITRRDGKFFQISEFGTLIEYDAAKQVVWTWRSSEHLTIDDFPKNNPTRRQNNSHMNSFYFDVPNNVIYTGFRNISRILKISYPQGTVLAKYGVSFDTEKEKPGNGLFYGQHNVTKESNGNLLLYNNNVTSSIRAYSNSSVIILKEPSGAVNGDTLKKVWEFSCAIDTFALPYSTSGGSVGELMDGSFLTCMGASNRVFIVNRKKEVVWNALCQWQDRTAEKREWLVQTGYRVSPIETEEQLTTLIFR